MGWRAYHGLPPLPWGRALTMGSRSSLGDAASRRRTPFGLPALGTAGRERRDRVRVIAFRANRIGNGSGEVRFGHWSLPSTVQLCFESGVPGPETKPVSADAGFAFFRSRQLIVAMGGDVRCTRGERYARIVAELPLIRESSSAESKLPG